MQPLPLPPELSADLVEVERIVQERVRTQPVVVSVAGQHVEAAPHGRLRATLVLLAAHLGRYETARVIHAAAAVELIHAATRTHDVLVDEVDRRLGQVPAGGWEHGVALMAGDYLFALAAGEMALTPDPRVIAFFSQAVMRICEETLEPVRLLEDLGEAREAYLRSHAGRTAALFAAAGRAGMVCGGGDEAQIEALGRYGQSIGLALRVAADIGALAAGGVPEAMARGIVSMPLIYAAQRLGSADIAAALDGGDAAKLARAADAARSLGLAPAQAELRRLSEEALAALAAFPAGPARAALEALAARALAYA